MMVGILPELYHFQYVYESQSISYGRVMREHGVQISKRVGLVPGQQMVRVCVAVCQRFRRHDAILGCVLGMGGHVCHKPQCVWKSGSDIDCVCVSQVWVYLEFEVYHGLKYVSGTDLCEREMGCLCMEDVHRARCNNIVTAQSTGVYAMRNPVVGLCVNMLGGQGIES